MSIISFKIAPVFIAAIILLKYLYDRYNDKEKSACKKDEVNKEDVCEIKKDEEKCSIKKPERKSLDVKPIEKP